MRVVRRGKNMKITEYKKKDGTIIYRSQVYLGIDSVTGKKVNTRVSGRTRKEVNIKAKQVKFNFMSNGSTVSKVKTITTYKELALLWWDSYKHTIKPNSYLLIKGMLKNHLIKHFGDYHLDKLTPPIIQQVFNEYGNSYNRGDSDSYASYGMLHSFNKRILQYGVIIQVLESNPARDVVIPRKKSKEKKIKYLDNNDLKMFLAHLDSLDTGEYKLLYEVTLYKLLLATGLRVGEACALEWSDIDFENATVTVSKTLNALREVNSPKSKAGNRLLDIDSETVTMLKEYKKRHTLEAWKLGKSETVVFSNFIDKYPNMNCLRSRLKYHYKEIGLLNYGFHIFRHTHASLLLNAGIPYKELQYRLGHSTLAMTMDTYSHLSKDSKKKPYRILKWR